ncbi:hypothetical protein [Paraglaciecola polaris]|uniref:Uncharacterized protein n=1 Tax=Paraglaciecola polaris LMG 21857 TaxID=1129793 RepID=K6YN84_9ALTE|nr:hypothetical protein [Paraglaciecola polaris]GAC34159.1 hypothetical protein GPLA_3269 [Paraglaciecola polaris LMG 21857]|tara:strand:+ start:5496 stop:5948 length:453 start_codon:yes stop_codon:yes gene_type:complete
MNIDTKSFSQSFAEQLRRNLVALISLSVAVTSLSYATWRNEVTEFNRNQRHGGFEVLIKLNELQLVVFHNRYDQTLQDKGNPRLGWAYVLTIQDLAQVLQAPMPDKSAALVQVWSDNWQSIGDEQSSVDAILNQIEVMRAETLSMLRELS